MTFDRIPDATEDVVRQIVESALQVHRELGPGLLESVYELCLAEELESRGLSVKRQLKVPISYRGRMIDADLRLDLLVRDAIIVEVKSVEQILPVFQAQLLTYMKLSKKRLGFLINFNVPVLKHGIKRMIL